MRPGSHLGSVLARLSAVGSAAAEIAFYFALSFVPFLGLTAVAAVAWLPRELGEPLAAGLVGLFPSEAGLDPEAIAGWVGSVRSSGWLVAGTLIAVLSSFRFMAATVHALARLGGVARERLGWRERLHAALAAAVLMLLWMLALLAASFVLLVAPALEETLAASRWLQGQGPTAADLARGLAALVLLLAIGLTYRAIPGTGARGVRPWAMAALATAGCIAVAEGVRRVLPAFTIGQNLYGALGSFVVFMLWCWANAWALLACGSLASRAR